MKILRLINTITMERTIDREFLNNTVMLLSQVGEAAIHSPSTDVTEIFVKCCSTVSAANRTVML